MAKTKAKTHSRLLALLLAAAMAVPLLPGAALADGPHWAADAANRLNTVYGTDIFTADDAPITVSAANALFGTLKTNFAAGLAPAGNATRLQIAKALWGLCGTHLQNQIEGDPARFSDTDDIAPASLRALGIVSGVGDNRFAPNEPMTDAEVATVSYRTFVKMGGIADAKAALDAGEWSPVNTVAALNAVFGTGVFTANDTLEDTTPSFTASAAATLFGQLKSGYSSTLSGNGTVTRAQIAKEIWTLCNQIENFPAPDGELPTYGDTAKTEDNTGLLSLAALGIIGGDGNGNLMPNGTVSDWMCAIIIYRAFNLIGGPARAKAALTSSSDGLLADMIAELNAVFGANTFTVDGGSVVYVTVNAANTLFGKLKSGYSANLSDLGFATRLQIAQTIWAICKDFLPAPDSGNLPEFIDTNDQSVLALAALEFIHGISDERFAPADSITNGQIASLLLDIFNAIGGGDIRWAKELINGAHWSTREVNALNEVFGANTFVADDAPVTVANLNALFAKLKTGYNAGLTGSGNATRLQMAQAIWALCQDFLPEPSDSSPTFTDTTDTAVIALAKLGIVGGTPEGAFLPDNTLTNGEAAILLYRTFDKMGGPAAAKALLNPTPTQAPVQPGGGGSSTPTPAPEAPAETAPVADNAVSVSYTQTENTITVALPDEKVAEIIEKAADVAVIELSGVADATAADVPVAALAKMADAGLAVEIDLPQGSVTLDADAVSSIAEQAGDANVSVALEPVETSSLNEQQQTAVGDAPVFDISISSGDVHITSFDGARVTITLPYTLKAGESALYVVVIYVDANGAAERLPTSYDAGAEKAT
ncbi:MAG: S-layer homology domain-containing protein, partial [Oscillospiraceae bacterium]|nr:S-layer homology domain-containing protein [Oscillospiraceae bacterium]